MPHRLVVLLAIGVGLAGGAWFLGRTLGGTQGVPRARQILPVTRAAPTDPMIGRMAPDFALPLLDQESGELGLTIRLSELRGQPVVLVFGSYT